MLKKDIVIVGGGPAGLSAAIYSARNGYKAVVLDPMGPGGQLMYIDELENYPGLKKAVSGYELSADMEKQAEDAGAEIEFEEVSEIRKDGASFLVKTGSYEIEAKAVILATGARHKHLGVPGEEEYAGRGVSYCATCDGAFFKGKKAIVAGGGDTALTDALYLSRICSSVTIIHRRNEFRAQKVLQDRVSSKENITAVLGANIKEITGDGTAVRGAVLDDGRILDTDSVFIFVGTKPNTEFLGDLVELDGGYIRTDARMRTSVNGILAAGDVRTTPFRQVVTAASDGAVAAASAAEYIEGL